MPTRERLVDEALVVLEQGGLAALNARMLSRRIGASTMVVYTHFKGMTGFYEALAREAFRQFGDHLRTVPHTDDPVADLSRRDWPTVTTPSPIRSATASCSGCPRRA